MIDWRDPDRRIGGEVTLSSVLRWTAAGIAVAALHAGGVWLALNWPKPAEAAGEPPAAIMMELAPLAVSPQPPPQEVAPWPGRRGAGSSRGPRSLSSLWSARRKSVNERACSVGV